MPRAQRFAMTCEAVFSRAQTALGAGALTGASLAPRIEHYGLERRKISGGPLEQLARPVLLLHAGRSPLLSDAVVSEFESRVAYARVVSLESAQHSMPISDPDEFSCEETTFLDALD